MRALADEHRLAILLRLAQRPHTVVELTEAFGFGQTLVSHHLKALRETGLVSVAPIGRSNRYSLCCEAIADPVRFLTGIAASNEGEESSDVESGS